MSQRKSNHGLWRSLKKMLRRRRRNVLWQMPGYQKFFIACGDSLQASSPGRSGGGMGKWRRACNYVSGNWILPPIPLWHPVDWADRFPPISANVKKHWKTHARGNEVITNVMSANQHFASTFSMQIFKLQRRGWKLSFFFPPRRQSAPVSLLAGYYNV